MSSSSSVVSSLSSLVDQVDYTKLRSYLFVLTLFGSQADAACYPDHEAFVKEIQVPIQVNAAKQIRWDRMSLFTSLDPEASKCVLFHCVTDLPSDVLAKQTEQAVVRINDTIRPVDSKGTKVVVRMNLTQILQSNSFCWQRTDK